MTSLLLLVLITVCYAAYNLLVKVAGGHAEVTGASPVIATISLQLAALTVSTVYLLFMLRQGTAVALPVRVLFWAVLAGACIGLAEIMYFYLFRGVGGGRPIAASVAIPFIVGGTIVITLAVATLVFNEQLNGWQWLGVALAFSGLMVLLYGSLPSATG